MSSELNPDLNGIAVAAANIVVSFCSRILVTWSPADIDVGVNASLTQFYPIILSVLLIVNRNLMSLYDAGCALNLTSPPITVYLAISSICDLLGVQTGLYKRVRSHRRIIRVLGALTLPLWLALSLTLWRSPRAFSDSKTYGIPWSVGDWMLTVFLESYILQASNPTVIWISASIMVPLFFLCLFRRRFQVMMDFRAHQGGTPKSQTKWCIPWTFVKCAWRTIDRNHKWWVYSLFAYLDFCWTWAVIGYTARASTSIGYVLSYGQLMSIFAAVPPLIPAAGLIYANRLDLLLFFRRLPRLFLTEVRYLATGIEPGPPDQDNHLPFNITSYPREPTLGKLRDRITTSVRSAHRSLFLLELDSVWRQGTGWGGDGGPCIGSATFAGAAHGKV